MEAVCSYQPGYGWKFFPEYVAAMGYSLRFHGGKWGNLKIFRKIMKIT
jgi:hypothetical protein